MRRAEPRPTGVTLIAVYEFVTAAVFLLATCAVLVFLTPAMLFTANRPGEALGGLFFVLLLLGFFLAFAIGSAVVGWGLLLQEPWSRVGAMVLAIPALIAFPVWTVASIAVLVYLASGEGRAAFRRAPEESEPATTVTAPVSNGPTDSPAEETREVRPEDRQQPPAGPPDD